MLPSAGMINMWDSTIANAARRLLIVKQRRRLGFQVEGHPPYQAYGAFYPPLPPPAGYQVERAAGVRQLEPLLLGSK